MNLPPTLRKLAGRGVTFSRALLKDGNLLWRPQPEAVLAPVSYRLSRRHRERKRLLLKVPNDRTADCAIKHGHSEGAKRGLRTMSMRLKHRAYHFLVS